MKKENFCKDCKWCKIDVWPIEDYVCQKHIKHINLITGRIYYELCSNIRPNCNDWERGGIIGLIHKFFK